MKVFVTGGMGFVGSHIVLELLARGDQLTILARAPEKIPAFREMPDVTIVQGGMEDAETLCAALPGHQACIHNALIWDEEPTELQLKDVRASANLFKTAAEAGIEHLIYTSSTAVHRPFQPVMSEESRIAPNNYYGATKAATESFLSAFSHQTNMRCNIIRPGPAVGKPAVQGAPFKGDRRFTEVVRAALKGEDIHVVKNEARQFIGVADLARLYTAVLHSDANRQTYLGVAQNSVTWEQIAAQTIELARASSRVILDDRGHNEIPFRFDVGKIEQDFGLAFDCEPAIRDHLEHLIATER